MIIPLSIEFQMCSTFHSIPLSSSLQSHVSFDFSHKNIEKISTVFVFVSVFLLFFKPFVSFSDFFFKYFFLFFFSFLMKNKKKSLAISLRLDFVKCVARLRDHSSSEFDYLEAKKKYFLFYFTELKEKSWIRDIK